MNYLKGNTNFKKILLSIEVFVVLIIMGACGNIAGDYQNVIEVTSDEKMQEQEFTETIYPNLKLTNDIEALELSNENKATAASIVCFECDYKELLTDSGRRIAYAYFYRPDIQDDTNAGIKINQYFFHDSETFFLGYNGITDSKNKVTKIFEQAARFAEETALREEILIEQPLRCVVDIEVQTNNEHYLSFTKRFYSLEETGSMLRLYGVTFSTQTGEVLCFSDFIKDDAIYENFIMNDFIPELEKYKYFLNEEQKKHLIDEYLCIPKEEIDFVLLNNEVYLLINDTTSGIYAAAVHFGNADAKDRGTSDR